LLKEGIEVLYDDREARAGEKFADSDLIGIPYRVVVSGRSIEAGGVELKRRDSAESEIVKIDNLVEKIR
jgi:prolyl-tRNA synthetase